jgi:hypothetical protein
MTINSKNPYITKTGMVINPSHAFFKVPIVNKLIKPFNVSEYHSLQTVLSKGWVDADTDLLVFEVNGQTLTLLLKQMAQDHVAQGELGGEEWAFFFCACCHMGGSVNPIVNGQHLHFRVTGIYNSMSIFNDYETNSFWENATGECIEGPLQGTYLETKPAHYLKVGQVLEMDPNALVATRKFSLADRFSDATGNQRMLGPNGFIPPPFRISMTKTDERLPELDLGLGVWIGDHARYYSMKTLRARDNVIVDALGQHQLIVYIDPVSGTPAAHLSKVAVKGWEDGALVLESGERIVNGYVLEPNADKRSISRPSQQFSRWYSFSYLHPKCDIYGVKKTE